MQEAGIDRRAFVLCMGAVWSASVAWADMPPFPEELLVDNRPVEPYCMKHFLGGSARFEPLDVHHCGTEDIITVTPAAKDGQGNYGYRYRYREEEQGFAESYIYYRYIGHRQGLPVLLLQESGGGSGRFSALIALKRDGDWLTLSEEIASGDRCNGGVEARMEDGTLHYTQSITPYDFLTLAVDNRHELSAYDDLEASASSCFGAARYRDGQLVDVGLTATGKDVEGWTENIVYQPCFNALYRQYVREGRTRLNEDELKGFTHQFNTSCIEQPT